MSDSNESKNNENITLKRTNNHIEEYFQDHKESSEERASRQIFTADKNVDIKTELDMKEISYINTMQLNDDFLKSRGLNPVFSYFYNHYLRLKISKDRKSRGEFVKINSQDRSEEMVEGMRTAGSLFGAQK